MPSDNSHIVRVEVDASTIGPSLKGAASEATSALNAVVAAAKKKPIEIAVTATAAGNATAETNRQLADARGQIRTRTAEILRARPDADEFFFAGKSRAPSRLNKKGEAQVAKEIAALEEQINATLANIKATKDATKQTITNTARIQVAENEEVLATELAARAAEKKARQRIANAERIDETNELRNRPQSEIDEAGASRAAKKLNSDKERIAANQVALAQEDFKVTAERIASDRTILAKQKAYEATSDGASTARVNLAIAEAQLGVKQATEVLASDTAIQVKAKRLVSEALVADQLGREAANQTLANPKLADAKAKRIVAERLVAEQLEKQVLIEARNSGLSRSRSKALAAQAAGGAASGGGGLGFLGGGIKSVARFGIGSALVFGGAGAISNIVKQAEELEQVNIRLNNQFESLALQGIPGATDALSGFKDSLKETAIAGGQGTEEIFKLGSQIAGLFASLGGDTSGFATQAAEATKLISELSRISGLEVEDTFNDIAGAVRSFSDTGDDALGLIRELGDDLISIADVTGVSLGELLDFLGRVGPIAAESGFQLNELASVGATILQGSAVGGAALAEQFGRILSGFGNGLDAELSDIAVKFNTLDAGEPFGADFLDNIVAGNIDKVLLGLTSGFNKLTDAQRKQILQSIAGRREGNTLAALLQNVETQQRALAATTGNSGQQAERFARVMNTLTGTFAQLKTQLEQLGQRLIAGGLGTTLDSLLVIIELLATGIGTALIPLFQGLGLVLELTVVPVMEVLDSLLEKLPGGFRDAALGAATFAAALKALAVYQGISFGGLIGKGAAKVGLAGFAAQATQLKGQQQLFATSGVAATKYGAAISKASLAAKGAIAGLLGSTAVVTGVGVAVAGVVGAYKLWDNAQKNADRALKRAEERALSYNDVLVEQGNRLAAAAVEANALLEALKGISETEDGTTIGAFGESTTKDPGLSAASSALNNQIQGAGFADSFREFAASSGLDIDQIAEDALAFPKAFEDLRLIFDRGAQFEPGVLDSYKDSNIETLAAIAAAFDSNKIGSDDAENFLTILEDLRGDRDKQARDAPKAIADAIEQSLSRGLIDPEDVARIRRVAIRTGEDPNLAVFDQLRVGSLLDSTEVQQEQVISTLEELGQQFKFGLIGNQELAKSVENEIAGLQAAADAAGEAGNLTLQAEKIGLITQLQDGADQLIQDKVDSDVAALELLAGGELDPAVLAETLQAIAASGVIQGESGKLALAEQLAAAERAVYLDTVGAIGVVVGNQPEASPELQTLLGSIQGINAEGFNLVPDSSLADARQELNAKEKALLDGMARETRQLEIAFGEVPLATKISQLTTALNSPDLVNAETRLDLAQDLADALREMDDLAVDGVDKAVLAAQIVAEATGAEDLVNVSLIYDAISQTDSQIVTFLNAFIDVNTQTGNALLLQTANFINLTGDAQASLRRALQTQIAQLRAQGLQLLRAGQTDAAREIFDVVEGLQGAFDNAADTTFDRVQVSPVRTGSVGGRTGGGNTGGGNDDDEGPTPFEIAQARLGVERAINADDPVALAEIARQEAQLAWRYAENEVDLLNAYAAAIDADNQFAAAVADSFQAQFDLAIAIANQNGEIEQALALGVQKAQQALFDLRLTGAGDAAIAQAEANVINAQVAQRDGEIQEQLSDLAFLRDIGDLTVAQYIAALEQLLTVIDPVAQEDIYQSIVRTILSLKDSASDLKYNIPDSVLPSFLEVRRIAQGVGSVDAGPLSGQVNNNQVYTMNFSISNGVDLEEVGEMLAEVMGVSTNNLGITRLSGGNRY